MPSKLRWGILGTGNIARQFSTGVNASRRGSLAAVGSRLQSTADQFAGNFKIPAAYGSYEALIADPSVDAVYNSFPNSLHLPWTIKALRAGKHVLCEKPLAMNAAEAEQMFDAAKKSGCILMEAFMYRCHPQTLALVDVINSGVIGKLRMIRSSFCYRTKNIDSNVRFVRELGGGGLMDIGCYCIDFAYLFAGAHPISIHAVANMHEKGVDDSAAGTLVYPNGIISSFTCGMGVQADNTAHLCGTEGYIEIPIPWKPPAQHAKFIITGGIPPKMDSPATSPNSAPSKPAPAAPTRDIRIIDANADLYAIEADDFAASVLDSQPPRVSAENSISNMRVLDETRRQIGLEF